MMKRLEEGVARSRKTRIRATGLGWTLYEKLTRCGAGTEVVKTDVASEPARVSKLTKLSV
jgi:hypothetical protein